MTDTVSKAEVAASASAHKSRQSVRCCCAFGAAHSPAAVGDAGARSEQDAMLELLAQSTEAQDVAVDPLSILLSHERTSACDEAHNEAMAAVLDLARLLGKIVAGGMEMTPVTADSADAT